MREQNNPVDAPTSHRGFRVGFPSRAPRGAGTLDELIQIGMPVPRGFVVTTSAYAAHAERYGLAEKLAPLLERRDWAAVEQAARAGLAELPLDGALWAKVLDALLSSSTPAT